MEEKVFLDYEYGRLCALYSIPDAALGNEKSIVIMGHGLASSKESRINQALKPLLNKDGIATLIIDFYSHGESSGTFMDLTVTKALSGLKRAYEFAKEKGYVKIALTGSSFSGAVSILGATHFKDIKCVVLKCPVFDYRKLWDGRLGILGVEKWKTDGYLELWEKKVGYGFYCDALLYDMPKEAQKVSCPVLIVHGDKDTHVPLSQPKEAYSFLKHDKKLHIIKGADHLFREIPHFKELVSVVHMWLRQNLVG